MGFCNYEDINDYCCNNFNYRYSNVSTDLASISLISENVYRIDKNTGQETLLTPLSTNPIISCDFNDDEINITDWECFQLYKNICDGNIESPDADTIATKVKDNIETIFNSNNSNILVVFNDRNIILDASLESQAYLQATLALANILYREDNNADMPVITDIYDRAYILKYSDLTNVLESYFRNTISNYIQKNDRLDVINNTNTPEDIYNIEFYNKQIPENITELVTTLPEDDNIPDIIPEFSDPTQSNQSDYPCNTNSDCCYCSGGYNDVYITVPNPGCSSDECIRLSTELGYPLSPEEGVCCEGNCLTYNEWVNLGSPNC